MLALTLYTWETPPTMIRDSLWSTPAERYCLRFTGDSSFFCEQPRISASTFSTHLTLVATPACYETSYDPDDALEIDERTKDPARLPRGTLPVALVEPRTAYWGTQFELGSLGQAASLHKVDRGDLNPRPSEPQSSVTCFCVLPQVAESAYLS